MSFADIPADTDAERIIKALNILSETQGKQTGAINNLGENVQWLVDNVQGIFQMFANPAFMGQMTSAMAGMAVGGEQNGGNEGA